MTPERWKLIKGVLERALELGAGERSAFLDRACADDQTLRKEVEQFLACGEDMRPSFLVSPPLVHHSLALGTKLGDYEVQALLGAGGMGEVYRARDARLRREVAIKVLPAVVSSHTDRLRRFEQEAQAAAALNHPNILAVYQMGEYQGSLYIVSELLEGETLREQIRRGRIALPRVMDYGVQMAQGVSAAHEKGIVHRDLKPENLFVTTSGRVKILDFGLAKLTQPQPGSEHSAATLGSETEPGMVMGTIGYMSPEQVRGLTVDHRADIFALGAILYEMLTGKRAFQKPTFADTMSAILNEDPPEISQILTNIPPDLRRIVVRCLDKNPQQRFQSVSDLAFALQALSDSVRTGRFQNSALSGRKISVAVLTVVVTTAISVVVGLSVAKPGNWHNWLRPRSSTGSATEIHSLAVLPLQNLSDDPAQEYFADGMTEELTTDLSKLGAVRVISRTSAMRYKGAKMPLPEIARELNVDGVIEGSVERSGNRLRITAQLIHAPSDTHLWAESYERDLRDVLSLQDEIARDVANRIRVKLTPSEEARLSGSGAIDPEAYQSYLEGRYYWNLRTEEGFNKAIAYFRHAMEKDPRYAVAYAGLAQTYITQQGYGFVPPKQAFSQAKAAASRALQIDESLPEAHTALAVARADYDADFAAAEKEFRRAIELNPSYATAHQWYAEEVLSASGRNQEAIAQMRLALELDPLSIAINTWYGAILYGAGEDDAAITQLRKTIETGGNWPMTHLWLGRVYLDQKMSREAISELQSSVDISGRQPLYLAALGYAYAVAGQKLPASRILTQLTDLSSRKYVPAYETAALCAALGYKEQAFQWLRKVCEENVCASMHSTLKSNPAFDSLRSDPRFAQLDLK